jgi:eukaryotic-like serine/threonine-protein kinase
MVWPPPKVLASPEGEATVERPRGHEPEAAEVSAVVTGVVHEAELTPAAVGAAPPASAGRDGAAALPGATVSIMAATSVPHDWLAHPEGLLGCVLGSRYRVTSIIGRGPMGIACEGESSRGRQVTLKLLPRAPELPLEHFAWQVRQALALAHFDHVNVAPINDFGALEDGSAFVSRARVPGVTLRTVLRQGGLPLARALDIARQIAAALATAHVQDIAHGRLKPENVVLQGGARPGDLVKVIDFGMAGLPVNLRAVAPDENEALRLALGTRLYLPADVTGASPAIDVYSLGVLLFEMIAGQPPFVFESLPPAGSQQAPRSFAECNPTLTVPEAVNELVFALMHPQAAEHGLNAERVGQLLDELLGRPSVAPPLDPVTAQLPGARPPAHSLHASNLVSRSSATDQKPFDAPGESLLIWPVSPAPAPDRTHSYPPLPRGFVGSSFPPETREPLGRGVPPTPAPFRPSFGPSSGSPSSGSPSAAPPNYPTPPSARHRAAAVDPLPTHSFPPPSISRPLEPSIALSSPTPSTSAAPDDPELELRPSFIGRLKRLFGKKRPGEF